MFNLNTLFAVGVGVAAGYAFARYREAQVPVPVPMSLVFQPNHMLIPVAQIRSALQLIAMGQGTPAQAAEYASVIR